MSAKFTVLSYKQQTLRTNNFLAHLLVKLYSSFQNSRKSYILTFITIYLSIWIPFITRSFDLLKKKHSVTDVIAV